MKEVDFILQRYYLGKAYTVSRFSFEDVKICDTLEDKVRDYNKDGDLLDAGETKVFGETAIPYGRRRVTITYSPKFKRKLPLLHDVPHFTYIRMHSGVHAGHTLGCILTGENTAKGKLSNGKYYEAIVVKMIEEQIALGNEVYINII